MINGILKFLGWLLSALAPLFYALVFSYLLEPMVCMYQRGLSVLKKKPLLKRVVPTALAYLTLLLIIAAPIIFTASKLRGGSMQSIMDSATRTANDLSENFSAIQITLEEYGLLSYLSAYITRILNSFGNFANTVVSNVAEFASTAGQHLVSIGLGFVIAFYFLSDKERYLNKFGEARKLVLPARINNGLTNLWADIDQIIKGYIRGQLLDALIMAVLITTWLLIVKVRFAIFIGIFSGLANIIPYFGAIMGFVLSVLVSLVTGEPQQAVFAGVGIFVLQQVDAAFITPRVVGERVELNPVIIILALVVAAQLFGVVGMLLAAPAAAIIKLLLLNFFKRRKEKKQAEAMDAS